MTTSIMMSIDQQLNRFSRYPIASIRLPAAIGNHNNILNLQPKKLMPKHLQITAIVFRHLFRLDSRLIRKILRIYFQLSGLVNNAEKPCCFA